MERPRTGRGLGYGLVAVLAIAVVGGLLRGILDLTGGLIAVAIGMASGLTGLLVSYHFNLPSGPAIVLAAGILYLASIVLGSRGGLMKRYFPQPHYHD